MAAVQRVEFDTETPDCVVFFGFFGGKNDSLVLRGDEAVKFGQRLIKSANQNSA